jgi:hypothetical protein
MMVYSGPFASWTIEHTAIAAARYPGLEPTMEGLNQLQEMCWASGSPEPGCVRIAGVEYSKDFSWAGRAFLDVARRCPK